MTKAGMYEICLCVLASTEYIIICTFLCFFSVTKMLIYFYDLTSDHKKSLLYGYLSELTRA